jgi:hypothetical protein
MNLEATPSPVPQHSQGSVVAISNLLRMMVGVAAGGSILLYFSLVFLRIGYPFELETFEGLMMDHVSRILDGLPIYVAPSLDFIPNIYPPFFYYLAAGLAWFGGEDFWVLRLISVLASVGCLGVLFAYVRRETGSRFCGFLSAGFYAATYGICAGWFDTGRVDSLFLFILLSGIYTLRFWTSYRGGIATGVLLALAIFTKQTALPASLPVLGVVTLFYPRRALWFLLPLGALVAGGSLLMDRYLGGWFWPYMWDPLSDHPLRAGQALDFWTRHVLRQMPIVAGMALVGLWGWMQDWTDWREKFFLPSLAGGFLVAAWIGRWSVGGAENALMPSCALFAILLGILFQKVLDRTVSAKKRALLYLLVLIQFGLLAYDPRLLVPTQADREAGEALIARLKEIDGDVWVAFHGHLGPMAGKSIRAIYYQQPKTASSSPQEEGPPAVFKGLDQAVREQRFAAILFDGHTLPEGWDAYYQDAGAVFERRDVFWPVTGYKTRPKAIFTPKVTKP